MPSTQDIARRVAAALSGEAADPDLISVFAPTVAVGHNYDTAPPLQIPAAQIAPHMAGGVAMIRQALPDARIEAAAVHVAEAAVIVTQTMRATLPDGSELKAPQCFVFELENGRVASVYQYADKAHFDHIAAALVAKGLVQPPQPAAA